MKKQIGFAATVAALLLVAGCQNSGSSNSQSSLESSSSTHSSQVEKSSKSSVLKRTASSKSSASAGSQAPSSKQTRFSKLNSQLAKEVTNLPLPSVSGLDSGEDHVNVRYAEKGNTVTVYYSVGNSAKKFNDSSLKKQLPYLVYSQEGNLSDSQMDEAINYQAPATGLPTIKLDNSVTATEQAGAGQRYLTWNDDNWSLTVHASAVNNQKPKPTANKLIKYISEYGLPKVDGKASIMVDVGQSYGSLNNQMYFKKDGKLYHLQAHSLKTMIKMAASIK